MGKRALKTKVAVEDDELVIPQELPILKRKNAICYTSRSKASKEIRKRYEVKVKRLRSL